MANLIFRGTAKAVAQVTTVTIGGTWADTETVRITIGGKYVEYTCSGTPTAAQVAAGLQALAAASDDAEFEALTWSVDTAVITATGVLPGEPWTIEGSEVSSSGTITVDDAIDATGPNHWDNVDNWSIGAVPTTDDEVSIEDPAVWIKYGLPTSLTLAKFAMTAGRLGLPDINAAGYAEFRATRAVFSCVDVRIGVAVGNGPQLCRLDLASSAAKVFVVGVSGAKQQSVATYPVDIVANSASAEIAVTSGQVSVAPSGDETTTVSKVLVAEQAAVHIGEGVTVTTIQAAGLCYCHAACTNLTVDGGSFFLLGDATVTTLTINGGSLFYNSTGTITIATVETGVLDCSQDMRARTITNSSVGARGEIRDAHKVVTFTNKTAMTSSAKSIKGAA